MRKGTLTIPQAELFQPEELAALNRAHIPRHIAIIPDGNRRWAQQNAESIQVGHQQGSQAVANTVKAAADLGIRVVTLYSFSTENWARPQAEVDFLMNLLEWSLVESEKWMIDYGVRLNTIGDPSPLPARLIQQLERTKDHTAKGSRIDLVLAINYGGRDEIRRAAQKIAKDCLEGRIAEESIDENLVAKYLDSAPWGDPDLLIRTSSENRISNFLLWQCSYCEFFFLNILWPDFTPAHLLETVLEYQKRNKRLGA